MLEASGLPEDVLTRVWDLADVSRDGLLDVEEFCVACHLLRFVKAGKGYTFYKQFVKLAKFWTWRSVASPVIFYVLSKQVKGIHFISNMSKLHSFGRGGFF